MNYNRVVVWSLFTCLIMVGGSWPAAAVGSSAPLAGSNSDVAMGCGESLPSNGSGYHPPVGTDSLPTERPRPGPDILYWPLARSPQLENSGVWTAEPILVSAASAYRSGEFLYQDLLYDDTALTYPDQRNVYAGNSSDLVELRLKPLDDALAIRITYNSMLDPEVTATTIALGDSSAAQQMPHNAGAVMPAEVFVTVHGCTGDIIDAATGEALSVVPDVHSDLSRRQVDVRVPYAAFDPRGEVAVRVAAASGLWDPAADAYMRPNDDAPAFFNVAFRYDEPFTAPPNADSAWPAVFRDSQQNAALASGDLSQFHAVVDFTKLEAGINDDMPGQPGGVPQSGRINRIMVSHFEFAQGRGSDPGGGILPGYACDPPDCLNLYSGRLQTYQIYVPDKPPPPEGYGLTLSLHGAGQSHNEDGTSSIVRQWGPREPALAERGTGTIALAPLGRGRSYFWHWGLAAADTFEAWADLAHHYPFDPSYTAVQGQSMGGHGSFFLSAMFPDLFARMVPLVPCPSAEAAWPGPPVPPGSGEESVIANIVPSLRNIPLWAQSAPDDALCLPSATQQILNELDTLGYRYQWHFYGGMNHFSYTMVDMARIAEWLGTARVDRDPAHITYVYNAALHRPEYGFTIDHAYWLSELALRDESGDAPMGTIDVRSHGFGVGDPPPLETQHGAGVNSSGEPFPYTVQSKEWGEAPVEPVEDRLDITAENIASVTIDVARARVTCDVDLRVESDGPLEVNLAGCGDKIVRVAGPDRVATAVEIARTAFPDSAPVAVIARADDYADALVGGPLAAQLGAPLLLSSPDALSDATAAEITRLGATEAVLLGGEAALSAQVAEELSDAGLRVRRVAGPTRYATAAAIAARMGDGETVLLARGDGFADALAASALGAATGAPVLLTEPDSLPAETAEALDAASDVTIVGGDAAVGPAVARAVDEAAREVTRLAGATRYETSAVVADAALAAGMTPAVTWVATGRDFPDALAAGAAAGREGGVLLLVDGHDLDAAPETGNWLAGHTDAVELLRIVGGVAAVTAETQDALAALL